MARSWTPPNRGKTTAMAKNVNTSNRPTMGTTAFDLAIAQPPLRGTLRPRGGARGGGEQRTAVARQGRLERLGPSYKIQPSMKTPDPGGQSASTLANGRLFRSTMSTNGEFRSGQQSWAGGRFEIPSTTPWAGPGR